MRSSIINVIKYVSSLVIAFGILYLLFKNQDPVKLIEEIQKVDSKWVVLSMIFGAFAYINRGLRWIILINALGCKTSKINSISAVSIGYFTNLFIPRAGEISRCTSLNQAENVPVNKLLGTILIERVIDFLFLLILLILIIILKYNTIIDFYSTLQSQQSGNNFNKLRLLFICLLALTLIIYFFRKKLKKSDIYKKLIEFFTGLKEGIKSIQQIDNKTLFWIHTFSIWVMYFLMTYVCFFSMNETACLTVSDGLFLLVLGGIGMIIPTPGGLGSYHAIMMIGLSVLGVGTLYLGEGGDPKNPALIFPTIIHVAQTLVAIIMGSLGLLVLFLSKKKYNAPA